MIIKKKEEELKKENHLGKTVHAEIDRLTEDIRILQKKLEKYKAEREQKTIEMNEMQEKIEKVSMIQHDTATFITNANFFNDSFYDSFYDF